MDFTVKPHVHARLALLAAVLLTATAGAQSLADPTRPPDAPLAGSGSGAIEIGRAHV